MERMDDAEPSVRSYLERARRAPRLTSLAPRFAELASGSSGQPHSRVQVDLALLGDDADARAFASSHRASAGTFNAHFIGSVPFVLEEQCRFGAALWRYGTRLQRTRGRPANVYTLGDAAGVTARALTRLANGAVQTLTCSPTSQNQVEFFARGAPDGAAFFLGPFFEVTPSSLRESGIFGFEDQFDVLVEDTTFQMYGRERYEPIALAARNLREDGVFVLIEKVRHHEEEEYARRERQKDYAFKTRYFSEVQIAEKRSTILGQMQQMEASLEEITSALTRLFTAAVITWNSGNFYTIAASRDLDHLATIVGDMIPPAIPQEYCYEALPRQLFGPHRLEFHFRDAEPSPGPNGDATESGT
jgi:SAM-dependent methyltransferase